MILEPSVCLAVSVSLIKSVMCANLMISAKTSNIEAAMSGNNVLRYL